ncbi:MAG: Rieske 2Fe-2S domain-containing protein [Actinomycetota bacterium]|nr:Rieske 2Fe-2S domain-containing protein [Actinomycetota bacterium]
MTTYEDPATGPAEDEVPATRLSPSHGTRFAPPGSALGEADPRHFGIDPSEPDPRHFGIDPSEPWPDDVPKDQDDTWWRYQDDPKAARRAELRVAFCWILTLLAGIGLAAVYVAGGQPQVEGALLFVAFAGLGVGFVFWARDLLPSNEVTASRGHHDVSAEADRQAVAESLARGMEPIARRPFLGKMLGLVGGVFGLAAVFPFASLGDRVHGSLTTTPWGSGTRLVTEDGRRLKVGDVAVNGILTVFPEGNVDFAQGATVLINVGDAPLHLKHQDWTVNGLVAFSKICTHAGCPAGLYNSQSYQLVCPCHQSTFDVLEGCKPVFGPASRSLPQLPLGVTSEGDLISTKGYQEPVGPGFWNRG